MNTPQPRVCPLCRKQSTLDNTFSIIDTAEARLEHGVCMDCDVSSLIIDVGAQAPTTVVGILTDMTIDDCTRLWGQSLLTEDDVLELREAVHSLSSSSTPAQSRTNTTNPSSLL